ncbi:MAG TPA: glucose-1-phosphate cytidylyltransferase [Clostridiales bacterium]|nr:glucose-1-phosphate cytidylyltransferase [Clostridiales bacterium]
MLAGGLGTRLAEETADKPKPMVEVGGRPILWHVMKIYAHHGFSRFVVCLGYKAEVIKAYFLERHHMLSDLVVSLADGRVRTLGGAREDWTVTLVDTGLTTQTGGRLLRVRPFVGEETFLMSYADGVADIDLSDLVRFHRGHGRLATVTAVRPPSRFGELELDGDQVTRFAEKPAGTGRWVSGGFFVFEPGVFDYLAGDETLLERDPLERLALDGQLMAYRHDGFWHGMDTLKDVQELDRMWASGRAPWKVWD